MFLTAAGVFAFSVVLASRFGAEFVPKLDEGDLAIQANRLPSVSLEASLEMTRAIERTLKQFPEVETVGTSSVSPLRSRWASEGISRTSDSSAAEAAITERISIQCPSSMTTISVASSQ